MTATSFLSLNHELVKKLPANRQDYKIRNILLNYVYYPATTAYYLDRGFKKHFNVVTAGASINDYVIKQWNLENLKEEIIPQDIPTLFSFSAKDVMNSLPENWEPDVYIWCDTGIPEPPTDLNTLDIPAACYFVDTHLHLEKHLEIAQNFNFTFLAQKEYVPEFTKRGIRCFWLPLGCDPEIHGKKSNEKKHEVGFVGSMGAPESPRRSYLQRLDEHFSVHNERVFNKDMAQLFSESKVVFNNCIRDDLNMRIFEAMCSGSLLMTDYPKNSGFDEMFQNGKHLAVFNDENIIDVANHYLNNEAEREKIAKAGEQEVLAKHTYEHRALEMVKVIEQEINKIAAEEQCEAEPKNKLLQEFISLKEQKEYKALIEKHEKSVSSISEDERTDIELIVAEAHAVSGKIEKAISIYKKNLDRNPDCVPALIGLGTIRLHEQNQREAASLFEKALEHEPANSKALCGKGIILLVKGTLAESKDFFVKALKVNVENTLALHQLVTVSSSLGEYTDAIEQLEKYIALHQTALDYCYTLASLNFVTGQREKALKEVDKILLFEPDNENAINLLEKINTNK